MTDHLNVAAQTVAQHAGEAAWQAVRAYAAANPLIPPWMLEVIEGARDAAVSAAVQSVTIQSAGVTVTDERTPAEPEPPKPARASARGEAPAAWPRSVPPETEPERRAPIQGDWGRRPGDRAYGTVPWSVHLRIYAAYAAVYGRSQSAEVIAQRGGFGHHEAQCYLAGIFDARETNGADLPPLEGWEPYRR